MEYQFTHTMHGVVAKCSMDHEAFAHWLNTEIANKPEKVTTILEHITQCKQAFPNPYEWAFEGKEFSLYLDTDEVMVKANSFEAIFDDVEMEDGFSFYDQESIAFCGLEDFEKFLLAFQTFLRTYH
ncbi:hypothetical protein A4G20_06810 [Pasteurellaceae bacterium RH1A]|nr:hypothetical protein A4G20_06810 [Pasteurellaceae bacterium RH1A]